MEDYFDGEISSCHPPLVFLPSLDDSISSIQHRLRNGQTDLFSRLKINHQLELRRLLDRKIAGLGAFLDLVYVAGYAPVTVGLVRTIGHEPASIYSFSVVVHRR